MPLYAVIFDMDGLLIDSEPFWREAEINIFGKAGVPMTNEMCESVMGLRLDEVILHWYKIYPWNNYSLKEMEQLILSEVRRLIQEKGELMKGVIETLDFLNKASLPLALASSSAMSLINTVIDKFQLTSYFKVVCSAETEKYGKPHPAIFHTAASLLKIDPLNCLVVEDSVNGVIAAKAARMKAIAIPAPEAWNDPRFAIADLKLPDLTAVNKQVLANLS